jgi:Flp pilus assembly pilin Flp
MPNKALKILLADKKGTTLIEVLLYAAMLTVAMVVLSNLLYMLLTFWQTSQSQKSLIRNSRFINQKISVDLSDCFQVTHPVGAQLEDILSFQSAASGQVTYQITDNQLTRNGDALSDNEVIISLDGPELGFRLVSRTIDYRYKIISRQVPLSGQTAERIVKGTIFLSNTP